jgi:hypothetical protein
MYTEHGEPQAFKGLWLNLLCGVFCSILAAIPRIPLLDVSVQGS